MALAASQARFLSLTARKTNVEYEGQQINQQRTALANQSAGLYNQMLSLEVPTPPLATDYAKTIYTFVDITSSKTITLDSIYKNPVEAGDTLGTYTVSGSRKSPSVLSNISYLQAGSNHGLLGYTINPKNDKGNYTINAMGVSNMTITGPTTSKALTPYFQEKAEGTGIEINENTQYFKFSNAATGVEYYIVGNDYENVDEFYEAYQNGADITIFSAQSYEKDEFFHTEDAVVTTAADGTGRFEYITFTPEGQDEPVTCKLTQLSVQDDDAFNAAMETYNAKKIIYDKTMADINAKTEILQQQDRNLELHLNQLDTEQQAIQTELDAVKKVIDKNIEETFKTFA